MYDWPGNVRQLLNVLNQTHAIHECKCLKADHLPPYLLQRAEHPVNQMPIDRQIEDFIEREAEQFVQSLVNGLSQVEQIHLKKSNGQNQKDGKGNREKSD